MYDFGNEKNTNFLPSHYAEFFLNDFYITRQKELGQP